MPRWHSSDWPSGTFRNTIIDLMDAIGNANAWPTIDLFDKYNPEYDAWAAAEFGSAVSRPGLIDFWRLRGIRTVTTAIRPSRLIWAVTH